MDHKELLKEVLLEVGDVTDLRVSVDSTGTVLSFQGTLSINDYPLEKE